jgi:hypothetical protein
MSPHVLWRQATPGHRSWLLLNAILIAAFINAALSALIAWGSAASEDDIPLWKAPLVGGTNLITDTVGTFFILPFLTTLVITTVVWSELQDGKLTPLARRTAGVFSRAPSTRLRRAAYFGLICMLVLGPPAVIVLILIDVSPISVGHFVLYKAILGVLLGAVVTPPIALAAMTDTPPPKT